MADATGANPGQVNVHFQSTFLSRVELSGAAEVAPQAIRGASGDAALHGDSPIQSQGGGVQRLAQGPGHNGGDSPGLARVSQEKDGVRILDEIPQPRHIRPGRRRL